MPIRLLHFITLNSWKSIPAQRILQMAAVGLLLGRAWQHLAWDAPYRELLWDEYWMKDIIQTVFGLTWSDYVGNPANDQRIQTGIKAIGVFYTVGAAAALGIDWFPRLCRRILNSTAVGLLILALISWKEYSWQIGQFLELTLQWITPLLLSLSTQRRWTNRWITSLAGTAIAATFLGHGLYAIGYYPVPGHFLEMTMRSLQLEEGAARQFLWTIGIIDLLAAVGVLWPLRFKNLIFSYLILWGLLTSLARVWSYFSVDDLESWLGLWLHELLMRFPHFLVPYWLWQISRKK